MKLNPTVVPRDAQEGMVTPTVGVWRSLSLAGIWSQAVGLVTVRLAVIRLQSP
jgi:hypothetical protein